MKNPRIFGGFFFVTGLAKRCFRLLGVRAEEVALSGDGRLLTGVRHDETIMVLDLTTGTKVAMRTGYGTVVAFLAFRPDRQPLASLSSSGTF